LSTNLVPQQLFEAGFTDLVSVIPPGATLTPRSSISSAGLGKTPGRRNANGTWAGYNWRAHTPTAEDVRQWCLDSASIGVRADRFPGLDIDCSDPALASLIQLEAIKTLGQAPTRVGRAPKMLLMYRAAEPFGRLRLWVKLGETSHLVEFLAVGQQYLVHGTHPVTMKPYHWHEGFWPALGKFTPAQLTVISAAQATAFFDHLQTTLATIYADVEFEREGSGDLVARTSVPQAGLLAPSIDVLREAVARIPNTDVLFPSRDSYIKMGYAIRAAGADSEEEAYDIFADWAGRHQSDARVSGNSETWRSDWRRLRPPFELGWEYLAGLARSHGYDDAKNDFTVDPSAVKPEERVAQAPFMSDQWVADQIIDKLRGTVRYAPQRGVWIVWDGSRWQIDAEMLAEDIIKRNLRSLGEWFLRQGVTSDEKKKNFKHAIDVCAAACLSRTMTLVKSDRSIAVSVDVLDHDDWILNTPGGIVDLKTGALKPADPDALCTKLTAVPPDAKGGCPVWLRFLDETTASDTALQAYLQRLAGYALTGSTREQHLSFIWGPGGNGKSKFIEAIAGVMGDYAAIATMDTFTASNSEKHSTDIASLMGARLVTASETAAGKRWDEQRVKNLSGDSKVKARFMRQDNITFTPKMKLIFIGNHKPEVRDVDQAMRRRLQMVPFTVTPKQIDGELGAKLQAEWPAILAWMIDGCIAWQQHGLTPPPRVTAATEDYFEGEDGVGRWFKECIVTDDGSNVTLGDLFQSWTEWANANGEYRGSQKRLISALESYKLARWKDPKTRRAGFAALRINQRQELGVL
jgi:P4 family phage/plasmid primase-like protien